MLDEVVSMSPCEEALKMLAKYPLCDHCLGRQFALLGYEMENDHRGRVMKTLLVMEGHRLTMANDKQGISILKTLASNGSSVMASSILRKLKRRVPGKEKCFLCDGRFESPDLPKKIAEILGGYEYKTFLVGIRLPTETEEREDEFKAEFGVQYGENLRNELSREIGKKIFKIVNKPVDYMKPEMVVIVNPFTEEIDPLPNPMFIMGRYRKLKRGVPHSRWICRRCGGKGCEECNWTGKISTESIEEFISAPILDETLGEAASFHTAGREDVDARMLGTGRPFIMEVKKPRKRSIDLSELRDRINREAKGKVTVSKLRFVDRVAVRKLKEIERSQKLYRVVVEFDRDILDDELEALERSFTDVVVHQQTPARVLHRRTNLIREKQIYKTKVRRLAGSKIEMRIQSQGGLYIKELITGDGGRTKPSVAEALKAKATPLRLDVLGMLTKGAEGLKK